MRPARALVGGSGSRRNRSCRTAFEEDHAMQRLNILRVALVTLTVAVLFLSPAVAPAQQAPAPQHPQDDALANEPAPWTLPGKWGARGNWGRWGEQDKRGML